MQLWQILLAIKNKYRVFFIINERILCRCVSHLYYEKEEWIVLMEKTYTCSIDMIFSSEQKAKEWLAERYTLKARELLRENT